MACKLPLHILKWKAEVIWAWRKLNLVFFLVSFYVHFHASKTHSAHERFCTRLELGQKFKTPCKWLINCLFSHSCMKEVNVFSPFTLPATSILETSKWLLCLFVGKRKSPMITSEDKLISALLEPQINTRTLCNGN